MKKIVALLLLLILLVPVSFAEEQTSSNQIDTIQALLEMMLENVDGEFKVTCNTSGFVIRQSQKDFTDTLTAAYIISNEEMKALWKESQETLLDFYDSIYTFIETCGFEKPNLTYMIYDPFEPDEGDMIFLIICNGEIVYDMLAE